MAIIQVSNGEFETRSYRCPSFTGTVYLWNGWLFFSKSNTATLLNMRPATLEEYLDTDDVYNFNGTLCVSPDTVWKIFTKRPQTIPTWLLAALWHGSVVKALASFII
jgi:hypothetical protein